MEDNFDYIKFLYENKWGPYSVYKENSLGTHQLKTDDSLSREKKIEALKTMYDNAKNDYQTYSVEAGGKKDNQQDFFQGDLKRSEKLKDVGVSKRDAIDAQNKSNKLKSLLDSLPETRLEKLSKELQDIESKIQAISNPKLQYNLDGDVSNPSGEHADSSEATKQKVLNALNKKVSLVKDEISKTEEELKNPAPIEIPDGFSVIGDTSKTNALSPKVKSAYSKDLSQIKDLEAALKVLKKEREPNDPELVQVTKQLDKLKNPKGSQELPSKDKASSAKETPFSNMQVR